MIWWLFIKFFKKIKNVECIFNSSELIFCRFLHTYEQIHFLGEDPKTVDTRRDEEGPIRKKHCGPQNTVPLTYNQAQHDIAGELVWFKSWPLGTSSETLVVLVVYSDIVLHDRIIIFSHKFNIKWVLHAYVMSLHCW